MTASPRPSRATPHLQPSIGPWYLGQGRCRFRVWAPFAQTVEVHILTPRERFVPMLQRARGYHEAVVEGVEPGTLYRYRLDGSRERPDPASPSQPQDVHGPSQVLDSSFDWGAGHWCGIPLREYVLYELHVGAYT